MSGNSQNRKSFDFDDETLRILEKHEIGRDGWTTGIVAQCARFYCEDIAKKEPAGEAECGLRDILHEHFGNEAIGKVNKKITSDTHRIEAVQKIIDDMKDFSQKNSPEILMHLQQRAEEMATVRGGGK